MRVPGCYSEGDCLYSKEKKLECLIFGLYCDVQPLTLDALVYEDS